MLLRAAWQADGNAVFATDAFVADFVFGFASRFVSEAMHPGDQAWSHGPDMGAMALLPLPPALALPPASRL
jgi:hypothetical protein